MGAGWDWGWGVIVDWYGLLECPVCRAGLERRGGSLACTNGHCFDVARQGYVNLLSGGARPGTADTREMIEARVAFFASGHFRPLIDAVAAETAAAVHGVPGCLVDAGAGTGEYLAAALDAAPGRHGLALDISKYAARAVARAHERAGSIVCDIWGRLPIRDGVAAAVLNVFAPRNPVESARILAPGGALIVVTPTADHLAELIAPLGMVSVDPDKPDRIRAALGGRFKLDRCRHFGRRITLTGTDAAALVLMGPSARHTTADEVHARAATLGDRIDATVSVDICVWRVL